MARLEADHHRTRDVPDLHAVGVVLDDGEPAGVGERALAVFHVGEALDERPGVGLERHRAVGMGFQDLAVHLVHHGFRVGGEGAPDTGG